MAARSRPFNFIRQGDDGRRSHAGLGDDEKKYNRPDALNLESVNIENPTKTHS